MSYIPNMKTVGSKLRQLFSTSGQTVESALPNKIEVSPSGSNESSGLSFLTLYGDAAAMLNDESDILFKNIECTEQYSSVEAANEALLSATSIRVIFVYKDTGSIFHINFATEACLANETTGYDYPSVCIDGSDYFSLRIEKGDPETQPK